jgi:hypothetical protein
MERQLAAAPTVHGGDKSARVMELTGRKSGVPLLPSTSVGVGFRLPHLRDLLERDTGVDFLELVTDNFLHLVEAPILAELSARFPIVLHGVGLDLLGPRGLDEDYLERVARLADRVDACLVTDHLAWTADEHVVHHELLPVPMCDETVELAAERARFVSRRIGRPFGLENPSSYLRWNDDEMTEWEFFERVCESAECGMLLDVNNVAVSAHNQGFDPVRYVDSIDLSRLVQLHVAGQRGTSRTDGSIDSGDSTDERGSTESVVLDGAPRPREHDVRGAHDVASHVVIDTHDAAPSSSVLDLLARVTARRRAPVLLEWDAHLPTFASMQRELVRVREALS